MTPLGKVLWRDLWHLRGQVLATALVVACGVMALVAMRSTFHTLQDAQARYYADYRLADVFARVKRAPQPLSGALAALPGVAAVGTRIVVDVTLDVPGLAEPAGGRLVSVPERQLPALNRLYLRSGRHVEAGRPDEVLVSEVFAQAGGLSVGDRIGAIVGGRWRTLTIVGVALSPEYVYEVGPGMPFPDNRRFGVLWMGREALAAAYDMQGAFNDVTLALAPGASEAAVIAGVDHLLQRYGGLAAHGRKALLSNRFLDDELGEIGVSSTWLPGVFLAVAAFLVYVVLSRLVAMQRTQIGLLKACGYGNTEVGLHYLKFALAIVLLGLLPGLLAGLWLGAQLTGLYRGYFHFPALALTVWPQVLATAVLASLLAGCAGALSAVRQVAALPPAEAMRPAAPVAFGAGRLELIGVARRLPASARMIVRNLLRRPWKALMSVLGIAVAVGLMLVARFMLDAVDHMLAVEFRLVERASVTVLFNEPRPARAAFELSRLPGVLLAEPFRTVPVRLRHAHRHKQVELTGVRADSELYRVVDHRQRPRQLPQQGVLLTRKLGHLLAVSPGDSVRVEVLEGSRSVHEVTVAGLTDEYIGIGARMDAAALARLLREDSLVSGARLRVDPAHAAALYARLKQLPALSSIAIRDAMLDSVRQIVDRAFRTVSLFELVFAAVLIGGMIYNSVRVALSERGPELASLRVLGFTRHEVALLLLGEQALLLLAAIPLGLVSGYAMCAALVPLFDRELFRLPLAFAPATFAYPVATALATAILSSWLAARRLRRLDLIAVLKSRE